MKDHTILVVVCVNNEELFKQCESQIRNIFVPQVMSCKFFRYEMHKVWQVHTTEPFHIQRNTKCIYIKIHILLIETCFLHLYLFKENEKLGLIGVAGAQFLPNNGIWWEGKNLVGKVIEYRRRNYQLLNLDQVFMVINHFCQFRQLMAYSWQRSMIFRGEKICFKGFTFMMCHSL